jgi:hypothetical protein
MDASALEELVEMVSQRLRGDSLGLRIPGISS